MTKTMQFLPILLLAIWKLLMCSDRCLAIGKLNLRDFLGIVACLLCIFYFFNGVEGLEVWRGIQIYVFLIFVTRRNYMFRVWYKCYLCKTKFTKLL